MRLANHELIECDVGNVHLQHYQKDLHQVISLV